MNRPDYTPGTEPMRPILIAMASSTTILIVIAATIYVVSCWGGR
jgi:hypothetical protein